MLTTLFSDILVRATERARECAGGEGDTGKVAEANIGLWVKDFEEATSPPPPSLTPSAPTPQPSLTPSAPTPQQTFIGIAHCYYNSCL